MSAKKSAGVPFRLPSPARSPPRLCPEPQDEADSFDTAIAGVVTKARARQPSGPKPLKSIFLRLRIIYLKALLDVSNIQCNSLGREFDAATTLAEKSELGRRWQDSMNERHKLRLLLESEENQHSKTHGC